MHPNRFPRRALTLAATTLTLLLAACGGSGDDAPPPNGNTASAQGLWVGTTATNRALTGLVLSDGSYFIVYSVANGSAVGGVVQGTGTVTGSTFSSGNARDFNFQGGGFNNGAVTAAVTTKQSFNGNISGTTFTTAYDVRYETAPTLAAVAGTYDGNSASSNGSGGTTLTIATTGAISSNSGGCTITGTVTPRVDGNAYNVSLVFGGAPCFFANQTLSGVAYFDAPNKRLYSVTPNAARSDVLFFVGTKP